MNSSRLVSVVAEAFMIYGLIIVGYGILAIHVTKTWFGERALAVAHSRHVHDGQLRSRL